MTLDEFAEAYAKRSGVTVEWLRQHGREARPCSCGGDNCEGFQMAHVEDESMTVLGAWVAPEGTPFFTEAEQPGPLWTKVYPPPPPPPRVNMPTPWRCLICGGDFESRWWHRLFKHHWPKSDAA